MTPDETNRGQLLRARIAASIVLFVAGALLGTALARLTAGALLPAGFTALLALALLAACALTVSHRQGAAE